MNKQRASIENYNVAFMTDAGKLLIVKAIHSMVWLFFNVVIFYLLFAAIAGKIDIRLWLCLGAVAVEGLVLLVFNKTCPLTLIARRYSDSQRDNFDIFLPNWLAKHNKLIYTSIVLLALTILIFRLLTQ